MPVRISVATGIRTAHAGILTFPRPRRCAAASPGRPGVPGHEKGSSRWEGWAGPETRVVVPAKTSDGRSSGSLCRKIPCPFIGTPYVLGQGPSPGSSKSRPVTVRATLWPAGTTTEVGQISTSSATTSPGVSGCGRSCVCQGRYGRLRSGSVARWEALRQPAPTTPAGSSPLTKVTSAPSGSSTRRVRNRSASVVVDAMWRRAAAGPVISASSGNGSVVKVSPSPAASKSVLASSRTASSPIVKALAFRWSSVHLVRARGHSRSGRRSNVPSTCRTLSWTGG